jgi:tellurite resistance protein
MRVPELTVDEAAYAFASLMAGADRVVTTEETERLALEWDRYAAGNGISAPKAREIAARCRALIARLPTKEVLAACERTLREAPKATEAVRFAVHVAYADGALAREERDQLDRILGLVGLSVEQLPTRTGRKVA